MLTLEEQKTGQKSNTDKDIAFKINIFKSNIINSEFGEDEIVKIINYVESKNFKVSDFYYTKSSSNRVVLLMKYTVLMTICLPEIEYITYEYPSDNSYVDLLLKRKSMGKEFRWRVKKDEIQNKDQYQFFMLKKVALTQALRIIFSDIFYQFDFIVYGEDEYFYEKQENKDKKNYQKEETFKEHEYESIEKIETFIEYWQKIASENNLDTSFWWEKTKKIYKSLFGVEIKEDYAITEKEKENLKEIVKQIIKLPK